MRQTSICRKTNETDITLSLIVDGIGTSTIDSGIKFLDHMLALFCKHGFFDMSLLVNGDLGVDGHHTVEDIGIVLGQALSQAVGDKKGIRRYAQVILPMDEALVMAAIDVSGRAFLGFEACLLREKTGDFDTDLVEEFLKAFVQHAAVTLHIQVMKGQNTHHIIEGIFKALAKVVDLATQFEVRETGIPSTKGRL